ncbi:hypothetical protein PMALA_033830, partial [Plasmodium malariae]
CNSDKSLNYRTCIRSILNSRNNRILSKVKNKTINLGFKYKLDLKKNHYLENKKYVGESDCGERNASKKKYSSKFADKALVKKYMSFIYKPHTAIDTFFEKLLYRELIPIDETSNFLNYVRDKSQFIGLLLSILSVSMVIYTLVKFLKYVIEVRRNEFKA